MLPSEPAFSGKVESFFGVVIQTTFDALRIFELCRRGVLPKVTRRLGEGDRQRIRSGSVFVFDERESGIRRWTDGRLWSPSRIMGNFLVYRELDKNLQESRPSRGSSSTFKYKDDGLVKLTMSISIGGSQQHMIGYYGIADFNEGAILAATDQQAAQARAVLDATPVPKDLQEYPGFRTSIIEEEQKKSCLLIGEIFHEEGHCREELRLPLQRLELAKGRSRQSITPTAATVHTSFYDTAPQSELESEFSMIAGILEKITPPEDLKLVTKLPKRVDPNGMFATPVFVQEPGLDGVWEVPMLDSSIDPAEYSRQLRDFLFSE